MKILSLGAGVQSSTLALMAEHGEIDRPDYAIFADTQSEPEEVYAWLNWLESQLSFPVIRVTAGSLRQEILEACDGIRGAWGRPPFFIKNADGSIGMTRRQCTQDYKLDPIMKKVRELVGIAPRSRGPKTPVVEQIIGISFDESQRMKPARFRWIRNSYPLVERRIHRLKCVEWMHAHGYPTPPKSACTFCTYHSDAMWRELKNDPKTWDDIIFLDERIRNGSHKLLKGKPYLHRSCLPIDQVDFSNLEDHGQISLFGNECEGMCGL